MEDETLVSIYKLFEQEFPDDKYSKKYEVTKNNQQNGLILYKVNGLTKEKKTGFMKLTHWSFYLEKSREYAKPLSSLINRNSVDLSGSEIEFIISNYKFIR
jgi:hypothetical protein